MKKLIGILLVLAMLLLCACGSAGEASTAETLEPTETSTYEDGGTNTEAETTPAQTETLETTTEEEQTTTEPVPTTPDPAEQRTALGDYAGPVYWVSWPTDIEYGVNLDRYGNQLCWEAVPTEVKDVLTGEVRYYCCPHPDENGDYNLFVLYDTEGNQIMEPGPWRSEQCMGDLLVRSLDTLVPGFESEETADKACGLYDLRTGETLIKGVWFLRKMSERSVVAMDPNCHLMGILDDTGAVLSGFPVDAVYHLPEPVGGYMTATLLEPGYNATVVLNENCRCILHADGWEQEYFLYDCGSRGTYCGLRDWKGHTFTTLVKAGNWGESVLVDALIAGMDGYRIRGRGPGDDSGDEYERYYLYDMQGEIVCGSYRGIVALHKGQDGLYDRYLAWEKDDLFLLDAEGTVLKQRSFPKLDSVYLIPEHAEYRAGVGATAISVSTWWVEPGADHGEGDTYILDLELEDVGPEGYSHIEKVTETVYWGRKKDADRMSGSIDLFTADGTLILSGIDSIGTAGPDGIPVIIGDRAGLLDERGNWIGWCVWKRGY